MVKYPLLTLIHNDCMYLYIHPTPQNCPLYIPHNFSMPKMLGFKSLHLPKLCCLFFLSRMSNLHKILLTVHYTWNVSKTKLSYLKCLVSLELHWLTHSFYVFDYSKILVRYCCQHEQTFTPYNPSFLNFQPLQNSLSQLVAKLHDLSWRTSNKRDKLVSLPTKQTNQTSTFLLLPWI